MNKDEALRLALEALEANLANWNAKRKAIPIIKQALEQPEPEPVAWDNCRGETQCRIWCGNSACGSHWNDTSPPKREWQELTNVDVSKILDDQNGFYTFEKCFNFAKAIEAKLKQKNL